VDSPVRRRAGTGLPEHVPAPGVKPRPGLHASVAPQHRCDVVALAALAPWQQVCAHTLAKLVMELVLGQRRTVVQRSLRGVSHLIERVDWGKSLLDGQPLDLLAELERELLVVGRDQSPAVEGEIVGRERVDRSPHEVSDDELAAVGRLFVARPSDVLMTRRESEQRSVAREVRGRAGRASARVSASRLASPERASRKARICSACTVSARRYAVLRLPQRERRTRLVW